MTRRAQWRIALVAVIATAIAVVTHLAGDDTPPAGAATGELGDLIHDLPTITRGEQSALSANYQRDAFGSGWLDPDGNGCTAREDILARDRDGGRLAGCRVVGLVIVDPYTGRTLHGTRAVQIDHVVPLAAAWRSGAADWTTQRREQFANDPANLLAVDGPTNMAKGDQTPDEWMPPNPAERCDYLTRYVHVSATYRVAVTDTIRAALLDRAAGC